MLKDMLLLFVRYFQKYVNLNSVLNDEILKTEADKYVI